MHTKLALARELVSCLAGIEVRLLTDGDGSVRDLIRDTFFGAVFPSVTDQNVQRYFASLEPGRVYFLGGILDLSYIVIRQAQKARTLVAGPCRLGSFSEAKIRSSLQRYDLGGDLIRQIISYCRWQSVLSPEKYHQLGILLGRHVLDLPEPIDHQYIEYQWHLTQQHQMIQIIPNTDVSGIRRIEMRYEASAAMTEAVKQGNLSLAMRYLQNIDAGMTAVIRNPDLLRNAQNFCIILNTQLRYALEERRVHPYRLDRISNEIATQIERLKSLEEVSCYYPRIIRQYCDLALEKSYPHLKPFIRQAVVYIKNHLTDNLTVKATAEALVVNANYLSGQFHREMGITFTDFVNRERTAQAASLLRHTDMQIQQIAAAVGYNNTSYFAKQFVRFHGVSPREYRTSSIV